MDSARGKHLTNHMKSFERENAHIDKDDPVDIIYLDF